MLSHIRQKFLETVEDVFDSDYKFLSSSHTYRLYKDIPRYQEMFENDRIDYTPNEKLVANFIDEFFLENKIVQETDCMMFKKKRERLGNGRSYGRFYMTSDPIFTTRASMVFNAMNPYLGRFQGMLSHSTKGLKVL